MSTEPTSPESTATEADAVPAGSNGSPSPSGLSPDAAALAQAAPPPALSLPSSYFNRELSLLLFQRRVLEEAQDAGNPLLERLKFLAILGSNLDEFFMVRVAGLMQQVGAGVAEFPPDGMAPAEQLAASRREALRLMRDARACYRELLPELRAAGVHILAYDELNERQTGHVERTFDELIYPVLTPLAFDPGRPFPHISNLSLNLAVVVRDESGEERFARVKVPGTLPQLLPIKRSSGGQRRDGTVPHNHYFVWIENVIAAHLDRLFPGLEVVEAQPFRVTRDADMDIQEIEASDLLKTVERSVWQRHFGGVVRLTIGPDMSDAMRRLLKAELGVDENAVFVLDQPFGMSSLMGLVTSIDRHDLKYPPFVPQVPPELDPETRGGSLFGAIRREDHLLHHPFDSFRPVVEFLEAAARDPKVLAIKQTLYRVGNNSPIVRALLDARRNGKQVTVLVELKARFDEESNIEWARTLEAEGVHVVYGLVGLKTHSKIALVVRREDGQICRYVHLATGNYNAVTANLYTDIGMFTRDDEIGADASDLFNALTGYSRQERYRRLLVAPVSFRQDMSALIRRETEHARAGEKAQIVLKMNSLVDAPMIRLLYEASCAGVRVDLIVRGICCLRPGVPDLSENIRVRSIVGRFLEHSRVYYFRNGGEPGVYVGSADLMPRNIERRVEAVFPVQDERLVAQLRTILQVYLADNVRARELGSDGQYRRLRPGPDEAPVDAQAELMRRRGWAG